MKVQKLFSQLFILLFSIALLSSCSNKTSIAKKTQQQEEVIVENDDENYTPPQVIAVSPELQKTNKDGEIYYDNEYGYRYWKNCNGQFYIDSKYEMEDVKPKKVSKSKSKKVAKNDEE
jgi:hypothetical protein